MPYSVRQRVLISVVVGLPVVGFGLRVFMHIRNGHAAETYQNVYSWSISWAAAAALFVMFTFIALGSFVARWVQLWRRSRLEGISIKEVAKNLKRNL